MADADQIESGDSTGSSDIFEVIPVGGGAVPESDEIKVDTNIVIRLLIPRKVGAKVIGRGGETIQSFIKEADAKMNMSQNNLVYDKTDCRVLKISGGLRNALVAVNLTLEALYNGVENSVLIRILIPKKVAGFLIGKGGENMRNLCAISGAEIWCAPGGTTHRILFVLGELETLMKTMALIFTTLSGSKLYQQLSVGEPKLEHAENVRTDMKGMETTGSLLAVIDVLRKQLQQALSGEGNRGRRRHTRKENGKEQRQNGKEQRQERRQSNAHMKRVVLALPDEQCNEVFADRSADVSAIEEKTGVSIQISPKGDFVEGTTNRKIVLRGDAAAVQTAQGEVLRMVSQLTTLTA